MNHRQKEIMKFIALGCIVAVAIIAALFVPSLKNFSLSANNTSVGTKESAAELASRITNMTEEERKEAERPPLPEENKAQLVNPEGETLFQQYRGNPSSEQNKIYYGDVFANPPKRHSFEGETPNPRVFTLAGPSTDLDLTKKAAETVTNIFSFRLQNHVSLSCAIASFESEDILPGTTDEHKFACARDSNPFQLWNVLMEKDFYVRVDNLIEEVEGQAAFYDDTSFDNRAKRTYRLYLGFYDHNNERVARLGGGLIITDWQKIDNDWKMISLTNMQHSHIQVISRDL